jgi:hypothetical protein
MAINLEKLLIKFIRYSDILGELNPESSEAKYYINNLEKIEHKILSNSNFVIYYHHYKNKIYRFIRKHFGSEELHFSTFKGMEKP